MCERRESHGSSRAWVLDRRSLDIFLSGGCSSCRSKPVGRLLPQSAPEATKRARGQNDPARTSQQAAFQIPADNLTQHLGAQLRDDPLSGLVVEQVVSQIVVESYVGYPTDFISLEGRILHWNLAPECPGHHRGGIISKFPRIQSRQEYSASYSPGSIAY